MSPLLGLAVLLAAGLVVYIAALVAFTLWRLRHPPRHTYGWAVARNLPGDPSELDASARTFDTWTLSRRGVDLPVWDVPGDRPDAPPVIVTHGWGQSRVDMLTRLPTLAAGASRVLLWDLPGCGEARGVCRFGAREIDDLLALLERAGAPAVLYGFSLGAELARRAAHAEPDRVRALILESPSTNGFTPAHNLMTATRTPRLVNLPVALGLTGLVEGQGPGWRWRDLTDLGPAPCPTLVLHGEDDTMCPVDDGRDIAEATRGEFVVVPGADHTDVWTGEHAGVAAERVGEFLASLS